MCSLYNWVTTCLVLRRPRATRHQKLADLGTLPENVLFLPWQPAMDGKENTFLRPTNPLSHAVGSAVTTMSGFVGCGGGLALSPSNGLVVLPGEDSWRELAKFVSDTEWTTITAVQPLLSDSERYKLETEHYKSETERYKLETERMLGDIQKVKKSILIQQEILEQIANTQQSASEGSIRLTEVMENTLKVNGEALHRVKTVVQRGPCGLFNVDVAVGPVTYNDNRNMDQAKNHAQGVGVSTQIIDAILPAQPSTSVVRRFLDYFHL
jgi:hypothetical protein